LVASTPIAPQSVSQVPGTVPRNRRVYRGATVDFDFKDAPIHDLLRTIADTGKVNIVVPDGISARVTVRLKRVPWDQALEVILASHGLWYRRDGNLFRIAPRKELDAEDEAEAARREAMIKSEVPRPEIVPLNYSSAADLKPKLEAMLVAQGPHRGRRPDERADHQRRRRQPRADHAPRAPARHPDPADLDRGSHRRGAVDVPPAVRHPVGWSCPRRRRRRQRDRPDLPVVDRHRGRQR